MSIARTAQPYSFQICDGSCSGPSVNFHQVVAKKHPSELDTGCWALARRHLVPSLELSLSTAAAARYLAALRADQPEAGLAMRALAKAFGRPDKEQKAASKAQKQQVEERPRAARPPSDRSSEAGETGSSQFIPLQAAAEVDLMEGQSASSLDTNASRSQDIYARQTLAFDQYPAENMHLQPEPLNRPGVREVYTDSRHMYQQKPVIRAEGMRPSDATLGACTACQIFCCSP